MKRNKRIKDIKNRIYRLAKIYDVKVIYFYNEDENYPGGYFQYVETDPFQKYHIYINKSNYCIPKSYLCTFFHELGHVYCHRNGIWKKHHNTPKYIDREYALSVIRTGLKAERWVDKWAKNEISKFYPKIKQFQEYSSKERKDWYRENIIKKFRQFL